MKNLTDKDIKEAFGIPDDIASNTNSSKKEGFFSTLRDKISDFTNTQKEEIKSAFNSLNKLRAKKVNILIVGASGTGKSETINALLKDAKIHNQRAISQKGSDSVTMDISSYEIGTCTVFDTPGLGDIESKDKEHIEKIKDKLLELDKHGNHIIDLVIIVLNGANLRDKAVWQKLINEILIPNMSDPDKLIVAINKVDTYDDGDDWDRKSNKPTKQLRENIEKEIENVKQQIKDATGVMITPIYYSAGRKEKNKKPWNLVALYDEMNKKAPDEKKITLANNISDKKENFENGDDVDEKLQHIKESLTKSVLDDMTKEENDNEPDVTIVKTTPLLKKKKKKKKSKSSNSNESGGWLGSIVSAAISFFTGWW